MTLEWEIEFCKSHSSIPSVFVFYGVFMACMRLQILYWNQGTLTVSIGNMVAHIRIHNDTVFLQYIQLYQIVQLVTRPPIENRAEIKILLNIQQTSSSSRGIQTYEHRVKLWARYGAGFCECGLLGLCYTRLPAYSVCICNFVELSRFLPSVNMGIIFHWYLTIGPMLQLCDFHW